MRRAAFACVAAAALTACTSSGPGHSSGSSPAPSSTLSTPTVRQLRAIVLQPSDLTGTWQGTAHQGDSANLASFLRCTGTRDAAPATAAEAHSQDYSAGTVQLSSQATGYRSTADVHAITAALRSAKAGSCYRQLARAEITVGLPANGPRLDTVDVTITGPKSGDPKTVVARGTAAVQVSQGGQHATVHVDAYFLAGKLVTAEVDFTAVGSHVPDPLQRRLVEIVAGRVAAS